MYKNLYIKNKWDLKYVKHLEVTKSATATTQQHGRNQMRTLK